MYSQELLASGLLPYASYYNSLATGAPYFIDQRLMHEYAAATNNEQLKSLAEQHKVAMRMNRHRLHPSGVPGQSPTDPSYPTHAAKRHTHENIGINNFLLIRIKAIFKNV
jgi:hypothetical protein